MGDKFSDKNIMIWSVAVIVLILSAMSSPQLVVWILKNFRNILAVIVMIVGTSILFVVAHNYFKGKNNEQ